MNRKTWAADFRIVQQDENRWVVAGTHEPAIQILLLGAGVDPNLAGLALDQVSVDWLPDSVVVQLSRGAEVFQVKAANVLIHEPLPSLYRALPLAQFDARARRFWQRVFLLARLPGGRTLLRLLARRARA